MTPAPLTRVRVERSDPCEHDGVSDPGVRRLPDDLRGSHVYRTVRRSLGRAFADDPVWTWLIRGRNSADRAAAVLGELAHLHAELGGEVTATDGHEAHAVWVGPDARPATTGDYLRRAHRVIRPLGLRGAARLGALTEVDARHPHEPHWYLALLGTDPDHQRRGHGDALVRPVTDRADETGVGCYLESSKESNVPYYRRFGFEVVDVLHLDKGRGPDLFLMWRDPR